MLDRFRLHLEKMPLISASARVLVGYSGGADSTCLLHLIKEAGVDVVAAHLHHGQRDEADKEMALCEAFATELDVPFVSGRADVPKIAKDMKIGLEEAGRHARYEFLQQAAFRLQCTHIATAHTRSDHVETILLNLTRGCGLSGLAGIPEQRENIVRPLLSFSRQETQAYCDQRGFWYHNDPANEDVNFSRARIRHRVLPELRTINPSVDAAITRLGEIAEGEDTFLTSMAAAALEQCEIELNGPLRFLTLDCEASFDRSKLAHLPPVLLKRALRLATETMGGSLTRNQTESLMTTGDSGSITCEGGSVVVEWESERIGVRQIRPTIPFRYPLTVPGETLSDEFGWQFTVYPTSAPDKTQQRSSLEAQLDTAKTKGQLYFRTAQAGDSMTPLGFDHKRKVSDLTSEAKLTQAARSRLPIICDMLGPIWIPGVCLDARVAAGPGTGNVLLLRFSPIEEAERHNGGNVL